MKTNTSLIKSAALILAMSAAVITPTVSAQTEAKPQPQPVLHALADYKLLNRPGPIEKLDVANVASQSKNMVVKWLAANPDTSIVPGSTLKFVAQADGKLALEGVNIAYVASPGASFKVNRLDVAPQEVPLSQLASVSEQSRAGVEKKEGKGSAAWTIPVYVVESASASKGRIVAVIYGTQTAGKAVALASR